MITTIMLSTRALMVRFGEERSGLAAPVARGSARYGFAANLRQRIG